MKGTIVKGGVYLALVNIFAQFQSIILNLVLARLLAPEDFGLIALSSTYLGFMGLFTTIGFGAAIIQAKELNNLQLSTVYFLNWAFAFFAFTLVNSGANYAAQYYGSSELSSIIFWSSFTILLSPVFITHLKLMEKDLRYKEISQIVLFSSLCGAIAAIVGAIGGLGVYALVLQPLFTIGVKLVLVLLRSKWRPLFRFQFNSIIGMLKFTLKFKASQILLYTDRNIDYLILGKFFSSSQLGYYAFSYNVMYAPVKKISHVFNEVLFPALSKIQDEKEKVIRGYFKSIELISMVSFPAMTLISLNAEGLIPFVFGEQWTGAVSILTILCFAGAIQSVSELGSVIFNSLGKPEIDAYFGILRTILTVAAISSGAYFGFETVAWFLFISKLLSFIGMLAVIYWLQSFPFQWLLSSMTKPFVLVLILFVLSLTFPIFSENWIALLVLTSSVALGYTYFLNAKLIKQLLSLALKRKEQSR